MRNLYRLISSITILYALFLIYILTTPLVEFSGVVSGRVAFAYYHLTYYGNALAVPSLDAVKTISLLIFIESVFLLLTGVYTLLCRNQQFIWELLLSALLVAVMYLPIPFALLRIVDVETANLVANNRWHTSAGYINFGTTSVTALRLHAIQFAYTLASAIYSLTSLSIIIYLAKNRSS